MGARMMLLMLSGCVNQPAGTVDGVPAVIEEETAIDTAVEPPVDADADGYSETEDCDDGDEAAHPGAVEVCNGTDDDCDQLTDDEDDDLDAATASVWHPDADVDGFGAMDISAATCVSPTEWVADGTDCDDDEAAVNPGATETCDTVDENCDGLIDETCQPAPMGEHRVTEFPLRITGEGPYFGVFLAGLGDIDADGADEVFIGSLPAVGSEFSAGAAWLMRGSVTTATDITSVDALLRGTSQNERVGNDSIGVGDTNGDGLDDFLLGTYVTQWARLYLGPATDPSADADAMITGATSLYRGDRAMAGLGDMDGDGFADVVVGDHRASPDSDHYAAGAAYIFQGPLSGELTSADADATLLGSSEEEYFGFSVAGIGDVNGDGVPDLAATWCPAYGASWSVAVHFGPLSGVRGGIAGADMVIGPGADSNYTAAYRAGAWAPVLSGSEMDGDGDGRVDLLLGGTRNGSGGSAFLFTSLAGVSSPNDAQTVFTGDSGQGGAGEPTWAGDMNQDGSADLAMSNSLDGTKVPEGGAVYLFYGPFAPGVALISTADAILYGEEPSSYAGYVVAPGGELTGDAYPDLLFSAPAETLAGTADGVAWVLPGGP